MNILESLRKIENKIYREQDKSIDLQGMYLKEDVDKDKLCKMINKNDIDGVIKYLTEDLYTVKYSYYRDDDFTDRDIVDGEKTFTDAQEASQFSNSIKKAVGNNLIDLRWDIQDENTTRDWELIDRKTVHDWDGFTTDYTLWKKNGEDYWVCVFGDSDIYGPEDGDFDAEFDNEREALEWFRYYDDEYEQYHDDDIDESIDNKELKEAKLGPYKYRYEIRYTAPNGKDYLEGASNDIDKAENVALNGCDHWYESPWESDEHKADVISSYRIIDSDSNSPVETDRLSPYKNKLLKVLTKSKLKEDTNSSFEFRTKDLQSASKIVSYIRNHFKVEPTTDKDDSHEWYCVKAALTPDQKREARQFVKKFGGYILGENLKESSVVQAVNSFRRMLDRFNSNGKSAKSGDWSIAKGGYDLDFEVCHKGVPVIDCVNGEIEVLTNKEKYLPIAKTITNIYKDTHLAESLKESIYTENGFKNRKEYLNSLADDYGVDVQTVYDLASVLGPDEDFDALVTELEDAMYDSFNSSDDEDDTTLRTFDTELKSYRDKELTDEEDSIVINYKDYDGVIAISNWIWDKCSSGLYVTEKDVDDALFTTVYRPTRDGDRGNTLDTLAIGYIKKNGEYVPINEGFDSPSKSLKEYIDNTLSEDTIDLLEVGDHLIGNNNDWEVIKIGDNGKSLTVRCESGTFYKSARSLFGYTIVEGGKVDESLTEGIELLDSDELEKYRDTQSQDRDYIGKKLWKDVQSVKELIPEATDEEAALIEKIVKADDEELYRAEDGTIIVAVLSDNDFGYEDAKQYIEDMKFQYEQDPEFYDGTAE